MSLFFKNQCLLLLTFLLALTSCRAQVNLYDGFEDDKLSKIWSTDRMKSNAFKVQSTVVRKGNSAAMITLKTGDVFEAGIGKNLNSERDELREANNLMSVEDKTYEYAFSLFLPDSFPIVPTRLVIAQWKQKCPGDSSCSDDSPVMAIRYTDGKLAINIQTDSGKKTVYQTTDELRNKWLDFRFKLRFSRQGNGLTEAWLNEKQIVNFKGVTCYSSQRGYKNKSLFYFKMGLYRDVMPEPMTIYIDEYSKKSYRNK